MCRKNCRRRNSRRFQRASILSLDSRESPPGAKHLRNHSSAYPARMLTYEPTNPDRRLAVSDADNTRARISIRLNEHWEARNENGCLERRRRLCCHRLCGQPVREAADSVHESIRQSDALENVEQLERKLARLDRFSLTRPARLETAAHPTMNA
jgi:uncharacterized membrane protein YccC